MGNICIHQGSSFFVFYSGLKKYQTGNKLCAYGKGKVMIKKNSLRTLVTQDVYCFCFLCGLRSEIVLKQFKENGENFK